VSEHRGCHESRLWQQVPTQERTQHTPQSHCSPRAVAICSENAHCSSSLVRKDYAKAPKSQLKLVAPTGENRAVGLSRRPNSEFRSRDETKNPLSVHAETFAISFLSQRSISGSGRKRRVNSRSRRVIVELRFRAPSRATSSLLASLSNVQSDARAHGILLTTSELRQQRVRSSRLAIGADDLDARGRSPMCHQRTRPSLGGEAGGRSPGFISGHNPK
jgi:hypothetical protein